MWIYSCSPLVASCSALVASSTTMLNGGFIVSHKGETNGSGSPLAKHALLRISHGLSQQQQQQSATAEGIQSILQHQLHTNHTETRQLIVNSPNTQQRVITRALQLEQRVITRAVVHGSELLLMDCHGRRAWGLVI